MVEEYCDRRASVCVSVCLYVHEHYRTTKRHGKNILRMLHVALARPSLTALQSLMHFRLCGWWRHALILSCTQWGVSLPQQCYRRFAHGLTPLPRDILVMSCSKRRRAPRINESFLQRECRGEVCHAPLLRRNCVASFYFDSVVWSFIRKKTRKSEITDFALVRKIRRVLKIWLESMQ